MKKVNYGKNPRIYILITIALVIVGLSIYNKQIAGSNTQSNKSPNGMISTSSPTTNATPNNYQNDKGLISNWKIYESDKFSLQYPADWELKHNIEGGVQTEGITVYYPHDYSLGGAHVSANTKFYRHIVRVNQLEPANTANAAKDAIESAISSHYLISQVKAPYFRNSFTDNGSQFEIYGIIPDPKIFDGKQREHYTAFNSPSTALFFANFYISNEKLLLSGQASIHNDSRDSQEYKIISSIKLN